MSIIIANIQCVVFSPATKFHPVNKALLKIKKIILRSVFKFITGRDNLKNWLCFHYCLIYSSKTRCNNNKTRIALRKRSILYNLATHTHNLTSPRLEEHWVQTTLILECPRRYVWSLAIIIFATIIEQLMIVKLKVT